MTKSSTLTLAIGSALALLALPALSQAPASRPPASTLGPERTDDAGAVGRHGTPSSADRPRPDQEPGRSVPGRTFAPESATPARPPAGPGAPAGETPRSPATGDASGGDRRTALPVTLAQGWREDPDLAGVFAYPHSIGVPQLRRVNDSSAGDAQLPTRRAEGANTPPVDTAPPRSSSRAPDPAPRADVRTESQSQSSPPAGTVSTPPDARATGEGAAPPPLGAARERARAQER